MCELTGSHDGFYSHPSTAREEVGHYLRQPSGGRLGPVSPSRRNGARVDQLVIRTGRNFLLIGSPGAAPPSGTHHPGRRGSTSNAGLWLWRLGAGRGNEARSIDGPSLARACALWVGPSHGCHNRDHFNRLGAAAELQCVSVSPSRGLISLSIIACYRTPTGLRRGNQARKGKDGQS